MESCTVLAARGRRVSRTAGVQCRVVCTPSRLTIRRVRREPYPALKDWNYIDFCEEPRSTGNTFARCTERLTYLAQAYLVVRVNHPSNNWGDKVENCKLSFRGLVKLLKYPDVKADVAKVRGARGREFVYKAESLAVELSGSSDDDN